MAVNDGRAPTEQEKKTSVNWKRFWAGLQAAGCTVVILIGWWAFSWLAAGVVSCVPWDGKIGCSAAFPGHPRIDTAVRIFTLFVSLCAAIWVGSRAFYTPESYEPAPVPVPRKPSADGAAAETVRDGKDVRDRQESQTPQMEPV